MFVHEAKAALEMPRCATRDASDGARERAIRGVSSLARARLGPIDVGLTPVLNSAKHICVAHAALRSILSLPPPHPPLCLPSQKERLK